MLDRFNRNLNYLRISVTDRCNLRCSYCMPEEGIKLLRHEDILSFDEIAQFIYFAVKNGVTKVRITGGEPLVRKGIITLVRMISDINGITDLSMTTNGVLLKQFANNLKAAGLHRVNISLDTIDPEKFTAITRIGNIHDVFEGIEAARGAELLPVKINCVIRKSKGEVEAMGVTKYCKDNGLEIRYIRQMDLINGHFSRVDGGTGGDCALCNRLRLTANGKLKPCLFSDMEFDIRQLGFEKAILLAAEMKPECGSKNKTNEFYNIGG
ncbi:MAG: radical SAM protein [Bacteroidetes bacterium]|nr:MAG: radical SAM protein [Bacteroidota bacterium]